MNKIPSPFYSEPIFDTSLPFDKMCAKFNKNLLSLMKLVMKRNSNNDYLSLIRRDDLEILNNPNRIRNKMQDYIENVLKTESPVTPELVARISDNSNIRLLHAAIGLCTESGEFIDALKKHIFYGKTLDKVNLKEELGDLCWYLAIAMDELGTTFEIEQEKNIAKLKARYGEKFSSNAAINRDLDKEREILES